MGSFGLGSSNKSAESKQSASSGLFGGFGLKTQILSKTGSGTEVMIYWCLMCCSIGLVSEIAYHSNILHLQLAH